MITERLNLGGLQETTIRYTTMLAVLRMFVKLNWTLKEAE
jgi:hypothetical protein